jgi:hypothetical protein
MGANVSAVNARSHNVGIAFVPRPKDETDEARGVMPIGAALSGRRRSPPRWWPAVAARRRPLCSGPVAVRRSLDLCGGVSQGRLNNGVGGRTYAYSESQKGLTVVASPIVNNGLISAPISTAKQSETTYDMAGLGDENYKGGVRPNTCAAKIRCFTMEDAISVRPALLRHT